MMSWLLLCVLLLAMALVICAPMLLVAWAHDNTERLRAQRDLEREMEDGNVYGVDAVLWRNRDVLPPDEIAKARAWLMSRGAQ